MTEYPKMLYRGARHADWHAFGLALHAKKVDTAIAMSDEEEIQLRVDGYGDVDTMIGEAPAAPEQPAAEPAAHDEPVAAGEQLEQPGQILETPAAEQVDPFA